MNFKDIPQFPRAHYGVDIPWEYLERHIKHEQNEASGAKLDLEPDFQRAHVWTRAQQRAFVEYALRGGEVGRNIIFNCAGWGSDWRGPYVIVDGKQRLEAVRAFLRDEFKVFGERYSRFEGRLGLAGPGFRWNVCALETRRELLELYLSINAGGTPHTKGELERVAALLAKEL